MTLHQAKKFQATEDEEELEEENLLETPLDKVEPYGLFKGSLLSKSLPILYYSLSD